MGVFGDGDDPPLTRDDFPDNESWLRHCHAGGIDLVGEGPFNGIAGQGHFASLQGAILGHNNSEFRRTWEGWNKSRPYISFFMFRQAYRALAFANCQGLVLDSSIDITWSMIGVTRERDVAQRQGAFLDKVRHWFAQRGQPLRALWVLEKGNTRGLHSHMMLHLPAGWAADFEAMATGALRHVADGPIVDLPQSRTMLLQLKAGDDVIEQWRRFRYMMKGVAPHKCWRDPESGRLVSLEERARLNLSYQDTIEVKRLGIARAIGIAALAHWLQSNEPPSMDIRLDGRRLYNDQYLQWHAERIRRES